MPCHTIISDLDIGSIYDISQIGKLTVKTGCHAPVLKEAQINFTDGTTFMTAHPVIRCYHALKPLRAFTGVGKVAEHKLFMLNPDHRNKGIAKALAQNEDAVYKRNSFNEVQLDAAMDGIVVWKRLGYEYANKTDEDKLVAIWKRYFADQFTDMTALQKFGIMSRVKRMSDIPTKYLAPSGLPTFGEWVLSQFQNFPLIEMYKRIA